MRGCLIVVAAFVMLCLLLGACLGSDSNDDGDDSNDCYYTDPIPHFDECR